MMMGVHVVIFSIVIISLTSLSFSYDPLDPYGNITIKWDVMQSNGDTYDVRVSIYNYQQFRHVDAPGWKLNWTWMGDEVIWNMWGAEATFQGNCSRFKGNLPHCCDKEPEIIDLLPGTPYNMQVANCCKGGVLTTMTQDPTKYGAALQMNVGASTNGTGTSLPSENFQMPGNFKLGVPGYSCGDPVSVPPSRFSKDNGRRWTQALGTWDVTCIYSHLRASRNPKCCVSLSTFYNSTIIPCPKCSCYCQSFPDAKCVRPGETPPLLALPHNAKDEPPPLVRCSEHMCPIRVHWHVKQSYREYWRVKITVNNLNYVKNYSQWTLVVQHPNLRSVTQVFSFNYKPLNQNGYFNDTGMFWGVQYYNDMLLQSGDSGNVQTEILLDKDPGVFTFREGWAFPRKISFNGDACVMPLPDDYPRLPNSGHWTTFMPYCSMLSFLFLLLLL